MSSHLKDSDKVIEPKLRSVIQNFNLSINRFDPKEMLINDQSNEQLAQTEYFGSKRLQLSPQASSLEPTTTVRTREAFRPGELRIKSACVGSKGGSRLHYSNQLLHDAINSVGPRDRGTRGLFSAAEPKRMRAGAAARTLVTAEAEEAGKKLNSKSSSTLHGKSKSQTDGKSRS